MMKLSIIVIVIAMTTSVLARDHTKPPPPITNCDMVKQRIAKCMDNPESVSSIATPLPNPISPDPCPRQ
ncbi:hypothetical protein J1614_010619 [Plenodomus biglobosus]|nr:hypothetical protein J1614_010619 [Plenodomus biglobosus]